MFGGVFSICTQTLSFARFQTPFIFCTTACQIKNRFQLNFWMPKSGYLPDCILKANREKLPFGRSTSHLGGFAPSGCRRRATLRLVNAGTSDFLKVQVVNLRSTTKTSNDNYPCVPASTSQCCILLKLAGTKSGVKIPIG